MSDDTHDTVFFLHPCEEQLKLNVDKGLLNYTVFTPITYSVVNTMVLDNSTVFEGHPSCITSEPCVDDIPVSLMTTQQAIEIPSSTEITEMMESAIQLPCDIVSKGDLTYYRLQHVSLGSIEENPEYQYPLPTNVSKQQAPIQYAAIVHTLPEIREFENFDQTIQTIATNNQMCSSSSPPFAPCSTPELFDGTGEHPHVPIASCIEELGDNHLNEIKFMSTLSAVENLFEHSQMSRFGVPNRGNDEKAETVPPDAVGSTNFVQQFNNHYDKTQGNTMIERCDPGAWAGTLNAVPRSDKIDVEALVARLELCQRQRIAAYIFHKRVDKKQRTSEVIRKASSFLQLRLLNTTLICYTSDHDESIQLTAEESFVAQALLAKICQLITNTPYEPEVEHAVDHEMDCEESSVHENESDVGTQEADEEVTEFGDPKAFAQIDREEQMKTHEPSVVCGSALQASSAGTGFRFGLGPRNGRITRQRHLQLLLGSKECNFDEIEIPNNLSAEDLYKISYSLIAKTHPFHHSWIDAIHSHLNVPFAFLMEYLNEICDGDSSIPELNEIAQCVADEMGMKIISHSRKLAVVGKQVSKRDRVGFLKSLINKLEELGRGKRITQKNRDEWLHEFGIGFTEAEYMVTRIKVLTKKGGLSKSDDLLRAMLAKPKRMGRKWGQPSRTCQYDRKTKDIQSKMNAKKIFGEKCQVMSSEAENIALYVFRNTATNVVWDISIMKYLGLKKKVVKQLRVNARQADSPILDERCLQIAENMVKNLKKVQIEEEYPQKISTIVRQYIIDKNKIPKTLELKKLFQHCGIHRENIKYGLEIAWNYRHLVVSSDEGQDQHKLEELDMKRHLKPSKLKPRQVSNHLDELDLDKHNIIPEDMEIDFDDDADLSGAEDPPNQTIVMGDKHNGIDANIKYRREEHLKALPKSLLLAQKVDFENNAVHGIIKTEEGKPATGSNDKDAVRPGIHDFIIDSYSKSGNCGQRSCRSPMLPFTREYNVMPNHGSVEVGSTYLQYQEHEETGSLMNEASTTAVEKKPKDAKPIVLGKVKIQTSKICKNKKKNMSNCEKRKVAKEELSASDTENEERNA